MIKTRINTNKKHQFSRIKAGGQALIEYAVVITCVIAALLAMQHYIRRALQGRWRQASDQLGEQYDPRHTTGELTTTINRDVFTKVEEVDVTIDGKTGKATQRTETINQDETTRQGTETVGAF